MDLVQLFKREFWLAFFLGSVPSGLVAYFNGVDALEVFVKSIAPSDEIATYFGVLFALQIVLFIRVRFYPKKSIEHRDELFELYNFWGQLGFTLLGIYRAILGVCFVIFGLSFFVINIELLPLVITKGGFAISIFLLASMLFSYLQHKTTLPARVLS